MEYLCKEDEEIVLEVLNHLNLEYKSHQYFNDGAVSRVILLNDEYIIKQNNNIEAELEFFKYNHIDSFQKLVYVGDDNKYVVYTFLKGRPMKGVTNPEYALEKIIEITSLYQSYDKQGYGYFLDKVNTWEDFLLKEIESCSNVRKEYIKDWDLLIRCVKRLNDFPFIKKVIHGDFGTHNFIEKDGKFFGVIDPDTVIGDALYDTLFAIVSNTAILKIVNLEKLYTLIDDAPEKIYCMLMIVLVSRISRCLKYHPQDLNEYMNFYSSLVSNNSFNI